MAFETYGNPWDVRRSTMNDTQSWIWLNVSFNSFMCSFCLTHTHNLSCSFSLWASLGSNGCRGDGCLLKMASLDKQIWSSQRRTSRNIYRALLRSTHSLDMPIFWTMSLDWFKYISGLHCVLTRRGTIRFHNQFFCLFTLKEKCYVKPLKKTKRE